MNILTNKTKERNFLDNQFCSKGKLKIFDPNIDSYSLELKHANEHVNEGEIKSIFSKNGLHIFNLKGDFMLNNNSTKHIDFKLRNFKDKEEYKQKLQDVEKKLFELGFQIDKKVVDPKNNFKKSVITNQLSSKILSDAHCAKNIPHAKPNTNINTKKLIKVEIPKQKQKDCYSNLKSLQSLAYKTTASQAQKMRASAGGSKEINAGTKIKQISTKK